MGAPPQMASAGSTALVAAFRAKDGFFVVAVFREHMFEKLCQSRDSRFGSRPYVAERGGSDPTDFAIRITQRRFQRRQGLARRRAHLGQRVDCGTTDLDVGIVQLVNQPRYSPASGHEKPNDSGKENLPSRRGGSLPLAG